MSDRLAQCFKQIVLAQLGLGILGTIIIVFWFDIEHGWSFAFGAGLAMLNTLLSKRSIQKASELAYQQPQLSMLPIFSGLAQRIITFAAGFAAGVLVLNLLPIPIIIGFAMLQLAYLACQIR